MPARRLALLIAVLTALFVLGVAVAVGGLLAMREPGILAVCLVAATAGVLAAGLAYLAAGTVGDDEPELPEPAEEIPVASPITARPVRIQSLPVAELPAPYLAAVMKGLQASRAVRHPAGDAGQQVFH